jgi:hypothetical protein
MRRACFAAVLLGLALGAGGAADEFAVKEVVVEGVGASEKAAVKDALRNAVRQVVGTFVSAETLVENDRVIQDKVLSASDGFVKSYRTVSKGKDGELVRVVVQAVVMRDRLHAKLLAFKITSTAVPRVAHGGDVISDAVVEKMTKEEARAQKTELLHDVLLDYPKVLMARARLPDRFDYDKEKGKLTLDVQVGPDVKGYEQWLGRVQARLKKVSLGTLSAQVNASAQDLSPASWLLKQPGPVMRSLLVTRAEYDKAFTGPDLTELPGSWCLWVLTFASPTHDRTRWAGYVLDADANKALRAVQGDLSVKVDLLDKAGEKVAGETFSLQGDPWLGRVAPRPRKGGAGDVGWPLLQSASEPEITTEKSCNVYLCPFLLGGLYAAQVTYVPERTYRRSLTLSEEEWRQAKEVRCTLVYLPGGAKK